MKIYLIVVEVSNNNLKWDNTFFCGIFQLQNLHVVFNNQLTVCMNF